MNCTL